MGRIISVANQKGGVGKTTTCVNLTAALHERGCRVLLCDFDPQGNSTSGMGVDKSRTPTVYELLCGTATTADAIVSTPYGDVLPASRSLSGAEIELAYEDEREFYLKKALAPLRESYDVILIDCPPSLGLLPLNAFCAADGILVPVQCEYYALEGLSDLVFTLRAVRKKLNPTLDIDGILLTMYDSRTNLSAQVAAEVKKYFPGKVLGAVIPRNVRLSEAPSFGMPVFYYDKYSRG
ncbi:MAG: ParA family protein, partial [Oscillospiraceae bacterium]|nr:ParA family protein [Oscillospiraceae bacterium]